jgi:prenyl protein peptidase
MPPTPLLSIQSIPTISAHMLTLSFAVSYVGSLYISKNARLSFASRPPAPARNGEARQKVVNERWRDDPDVIKARLASVSLATFVCCVGVLAVVWHSLRGGNITFSMALHDTSRRLGLHFDMNTRSWLIYPHLITPLLFLGPLYSRYLSESLPFQRRWFFRSEVLPIFFTWQGIRNYLLAPITEELVFRACVLSMYHLSGASTKRMIFLSPLSFGAAHIHHAWDTYNRYGKTPGAFKRAIIMMLFQLSYTSIFGFHCAFLFLRTGSILPPISAHVFCNIIGLPHLGMELSQFPRRKTAILGAYLIGVVALAYALFSWTYVRDGLYWPHSSYRY